MIPLLLLLNLLSSLVIDALQIVHRPSSFSSIHPSDLHTNLSSVSFLQANLSVSHQVRKSAVGDFLYACTVVYADTLSLVKPKSLYDYSTKELFKGIQDIASQLDSLKSKSDSYGILSAVQKQAISLGKEKMSPANKGKKTILIEGLGAVGGYVALRSALYGHSVTVIEKNAKFQENQALQFYDVSEDILKFLGLTTSWDGFCKGSLQYTYLFLLALLSPWNKVTFELAEIFNWEVDVEDGGEDVMTLEWRGGSRTEQREWLQANGIYHQDYHTFATVQKSAKKVAWSADGQEPVSVGYPADMIIAAGGAISSFHWILPKLKTQWDYGFTQKDDENLEDHDAYYNFGVVRTIGMKLIFPLLVDSKPKFKDTEAYENAIAKAIPRKKSGSLDNYQVKYIPLADFMYTENNEIWFETVLNQESLTANWDELKPLIDSTVTLDDLFQGSLSIRGDFTLRFEESSFLGSSCKLSKAYTGNCKLPANFATILQNWLFNYELYPQLEKVGAKFDLSNARLAIWYQRNRLIPKKDLIYKLGERSKVYFVGDAFHESHFVRGDGLKNHVVELAPALAGIKQPDFFQIMNENNPDKITQLELAWKNGAYKIGRRYCEQSGHFLREG